MQDAWLKEYDDTNWQEEAAVLQAQTWVEETLKEKTIPLDGKHQNT